MGLSPTNSDPLGDSKYGDIKKALTARHMGTRDWPTNQGSPSRSPSKARSYAGVTKSSPTKGSPTKRRQEPSGYRFHFGKHRGKTIQEVMNVHSSYILEFILRKPEVLDDKPDLVEAFRELPNDYLDRNDPLRRALERADVFETSNSNVSGPVHEEDQNDGYRSWEAIDLSIVRNFESRAPAAVLEDSGLEDADAISPVVASFTGTIIKASRLYGDFSSPGGDTLVIKPCGWKEELIENDLGPGVHFTPADPDDLGAMVYQTYRFHATVYVKGSLERFSLLQSPEPATLQKGICFAVKGAVLSVGNRDFRIRIMSKSWSSKIVEGKMTLRLADGVEKPDVGVEYQFRGIIPPSSKKISDEVIEVHSYKKVETKL